MARINLLPWREEQRRERQRQFMTTLFMTAVLGVVLAPVTGVAYWGLRDAGAFKIEEGETRPIRVDRPCRQPVRVVGSRSHRGSSLDGYLARLGAHEMVPMGSSLKLCLVAAGDADVYPRLGPTCEWDTAAAQGVVEAAGGQVVEALQGHGHVQGDAVGHRMETRREEGLVTMGKSINPGGRG